MPGRAAGLLLTVKQTVPPVRAGAVRRDRLQHRLRDADTRLVTLVAPAGWGKTSLLSAWARDPAERCRIAWVSLDDGDDEPVRFWSYLLTALRSASDEISSNALDALDAPGVDPLDVAVPLLLNELAETSVPHALVLDDYHVITDPRIHEAVEFLVTYLPASSRLVVAGRSDPPLPIARLRARGELTELRASELRFSRDEAAALLSRVSGADLDDAAAAAVWDRAEGWAAGLQLAGLALRGQSQPAAAASRVTGRDRHLMDYFAAEIIPGLSVQQRDLLVRAAPLERLSGGLCDAALQITGSAAVLAELDRADLFVTALDTDGEWYRCHRLLRDALLSWPAASPAGAREVLTRAADWFAENDRLDEAAAHLLRTGDERATAAFLEASILWFSTRGLAAGYLALGEKLSEAVVGPELALWLSYAAMVSGRPDRAVTWLNACEARIAPDTELAGWRHAGAAALSMRASIGIPFSDSALAVDRARRALDLEAAAGNPANGLARSNLGVALLRDGDFAEAADLLDGSWRERDRHEWSRAVALQVAGCLGLSLLEPAPLPGGRAGPARGAAARRRSRARLGGRRLDGQHAAGGRGPVPLPAGRFRGSPGPSDPSGRAGRGAVPPDGPGSRAGVSRRRRARLR
ncbi:MAG TPA: hypothetical protein VHN80_02885 [Kineosporiaceae bacterium]|nr:hypothetical protein [Kineosporiaceae bacterium]